MSSKASQNPLMMLSSSAVLSLDGSGKIRCVGVPEVAGSDEEDATPVTAWSREPEACDEAGVDDNGVECDS